MRACVWVGAGCSGLRGYSQIARVAISLPPHPAPFQPLLLQSEVHHAFLYVFASPPQSPHCQGDPVLTDFGLARIVSSTLGAYTTQNMSGTPQYM